MGNVQRKEWTDVGGRPVSSAARSLVLRTERLRIPGDAAPVDSQQQERLLLQAPLEDLA